MLNFEFCQKLMRNLSILFSLIFTWFAFHPSTAAARDTPKKSVYLSTGLDGYILSSALLDKNNITNGPGFTIPRFTAFLHFGLNANFDLSKSFGIYSGVSVKNIGFIEKYAVLDSTVIRRAYTFGIPLGLKVGKINHGNYLLIGGGVDFPFNYKEKGFVKRDSKDKFNEWFSNRVPALMPYVFIGAHLHPGVAFKLQYYPTNFLNTSYTELVNGVLLEPYRHYNVNLCLLTLGININYRPKEVIRKTFTYR